MKETWCHLVQALSDATLTVHIAIPISYISIIIFNRSWRNIWTCCRRKITNIDEKEVYEKSKKNQNKGIAIYGLMIPERCRNIRQRHYFVIFLRSDCLSPSFSFPFFYAENSLFLFICILSFPSLVPRYQ